MPQDDLFITNILIGIIAGVQLAFLLGILVAGLYVRRTLTQVQASVRDLEREHVAPLRAQAERILADVSRISARAESQAARVDEHITDSLDAAVVQVRKMRNAVDTVTRETTAVASGVRAAMSAVAGRVARHDHPTSRVSMPADVFPEDRDHASR